MPTTDSDSPDDGANAAGIYAQNREILRGIAERLRTETDIDIDELIPLVDQASAAYKACRQRVEAVEKTILERLPPTDDTDE